MDVVLVDLRVSRCDFGWFGLFMVVAAVVFCIGSCARLRLLTINLVWIWLRVVLDFCCGLLVCLLLALWFVCYGFLVVYLLIAVHVNSVVYSFMIFIVLMCGCYVMI